MDLRNLESKIIYRKKIKLRCYSIEKHDKSYITNNRSKSGRLVILKFCDIATGKHITSISMWNVCNIDAFEKSKVEKRPLEFECVDIKLDQPHVYKYDWDDVNDGVCTKEHLGELRRISPIGFQKYNSVKLFICVEGIKEYPEGYEDLFMTLLEQKFYDVYNAHYVPCGTSEFLKAAQYKNDYLERKERLYRELHQEDEYIDYDSSYDGEPYDRSDMSAEDIEMEALENGLGELLGH